MEVFLTYLIGNAVALQKCFFFMGFFFMGFFLLPLMPVFYYAFERKGFFIWVSFIIFCFILSCTIPDSQTCVAMLNTMKS